MHPISETLCRVYELLLSKGQVSFPLTERNKEALDSIIKTVHGSYFGFDRFPNPEDKATAYLVLVVKGHPLTDGNKRTALLWFQVYCDVEGLKPNEPEFGYDALMVAIEQSDPDKLDDLMKPVQNLLFAPTIT